MCNALHTYYSICLRCNNAHIIVFKHCIGLEQTTCIHRTCIVCTLPYPISCSAHCACLSLFSDVYACGFADSSVHLWSRLPTELRHMTSNHPVKLQSDHHVLRGHQGSVYGVTFDSSGQYLLSCSEDCTIRLWDTPTRCSTVSYRGHTYPVWDVAFR